MHVLCEPSYFLAKLISWQHRKKGVHGINANYMHSLALIIRWAVIVAHLYGDAQFFLLPRNLTKQLWYTWCGNSCLSSDIPLMPFEKDRWRSCSQLGNVACHHQYLIKFSHGCYKNTFEKAWRPFCPCHSGNLVRKIYHNGVWWPTSLFYHVMDRHILSQSAHYNRFKIFANFIQMISHMFERQHWWWPPPSTKVLFAALLSIFLVRPAHANICWLHLQIFLRSVGRSWSPGWS